MAKQKNEFRVKVFIKAPTPEQLIQAQINNNMKDKKEYDYTDIQRHGNMWFAFYYKNLRPANADV